MEISRNKMRLIAGSESNVQRGCTISQYMNIKKNNTERMAVCRWSYLCKLDVQNMMGILNK
jgi:hypothetical protein